MKIDDKIQETVEKAIGPEIVEPDVKRELTPDDFAVDTLETTSNEKTKLFNITKVTKQSEADSGNSIVIPEIKNLDEVFTKV